MTVGHRSNPASDRMIPFDLTEHLRPHRLTIAMWDYSWLNAHYPTGSFGDFDRVTDELLERGFNTVRIEAFPWVIGQLTHPEEETTVKGDPLANWGPSDVDRKHAVAHELFEFMEITRRKGIFVMLSSWGVTHPEYPEKRPGDFFQVWERTLSLLDERGLLAHVLFIDLDQEFPFFSPFRPQLESLAGRSSASSGLAEAMGEAGVLRSQRGFQWNEAQLDMVGDHFRNAMSHFQRRYPEHRFTISLTGFWEEVRSLKLKCLDVLELHFWMSKSSRFTHRSGWMDVRKDRGDHDHSAYQKGIDATLSSMRPMLMADMHGQLQQAMDWSVEAGAPVATSEGWGPWWHMDHPDLSWGWLRDWCVECNVLAAQYGLWGSTPWNFSHPYWENWRDIGWYQEVNHSFLTTERMSSNRRPTA